MSTDQFKLPVIESIKIAWEKAKGYKSTFWAVLGIVILFNIARWLMRYSVKHEYVVDSTLIMVLSGIGIVLYILIHLFNWASLYLGIQRANDVPIRFGMVSYVFHLGLFIRMVLGGILLTLILLPGMISVFAPYYTPFVEQVNQIRAGVDPETLPKIAPLWTEITTPLFFFGLLWSIYFGMRTFIMFGLIINNKLGPIEALKLSFIATQSNVLRLFGLTILNIGIFMLGIITVGVGLIWILPYLYVNFGVVYKMLLSRTGVSVA